MNRKIINAPDAPAAIGPYVHAILSGDLVFTSGQLGLNPETGELAEGIEAQTQQSLENIKAVLNTTGIGRENIIKTTIFVADLDDFDKVNAVYGDFFGGDAPARSCVQVARLPKDALVEIEAIAAK